MYNVYVIDELTKENLLALLEEIQINGDDPMKLFAWKEGEQSIIQQCISDLKQLDRLEDEFELNIE